LKKIKIVDIGERVPWIRLQKWLVKDGGQVKEGQSVAQVETDKAIVDVPAPIGGMIRIVIKENTDLHYGDTLACIGTAKELASISRRRNRKRP
jgi:pyruvate dehydrogenase E2 component (dihydrolipoamide acetyltransferase)